VEGDYSKGWFLFTYQFSSKGRTRLLMESLIMPGSGLKESRVLRIAEKDGVCDGKDKLDRA
jgi:hypothetical protein